MSNPLPGSSPFPPAATNTTAPPLATNTPAFPPLPASSGSPLPPLATFPLSQSTISTKVVVVMVVVVVVVLSLLFMHCKKKGWRLCSAASSSNDLGYSVSRFTFGDLKKFTDHFSEANLLGEGGFGPVYRGVLPPNGTEVAVKRLRVGSGQGEREFLTEVKILDRTHHRHVVPLVGYCENPSERILVYELVPNNTLEFHLHGEGQPTLEWPTRLKIALGSAKGLAYLHEGCHPKVIHRDIKATNILVDFEFEAKIADFGLAKCISDSKSHVSTAVKGTFGYLAPEYLLTGKLTEKSDIYSFGVVLLELITGRKPRGSTENSMGLVDWARSQLTRAPKDGNFGLFVDPRLQNNYEHNEMARMVACAAACVRQSAKRRPKMSKIVRALEGDLPLSDLDDGIRPGLSILHHCRGSSDCSTSQGLGNSRRMGLARQEYGSSHYSEHTSGSTSVGSSRRTT